MNKNNKYTTEKLQKAVRQRSVRLNSGALATAAVAAGTALTQIPMTNNPLTVVNNLSTFIFGLIRAVGLILLGWGIVQVGLSLQSHDPSQRSNGFLTLAGGIIITFAKEILNLITA